MDRPFNFQIHQPDNRVKLARVLSHIESFAQPLNGKGGCSTFQIAIELARCLIAAFTFSVNDSSPSVDHVTSFVIHCHALLFEYKEEDRVFMEEMRSPPDTDCWALFFYLVTRELDAHPNQSIACEHSTLMVAKHIYFARWVRDTAHNKPAFDQLCLDFSNAQIAALAQRAHREPTLLHFSIFSSHSSIIYRPTADAAACAFHVVRFLGHSLREHNIIVCTDNINRAFAKILASCALWNGFHVGYVFAAEFMQQFLPDSMRGMGTLGRGVLAPDFRISTTFLRLVHYCAAIWQPVHDEAAQNVATELQEEGEAVAVERVLDAVLRSSDPLGRITTETLEAIIVRDPPRECVRLLFRRENLTAPVLHAGAYPRNLMALTGAPSYHFAPPACQLTPAEVICYFPNVLCIPEIWSWISYHGWTPLLNRTRGLEGIWKTNWATFRNWQAAASAYFRQNRDLTLPPPTPKLDISPYVHSYCNSQRRGVQKPMVEVSMSRLVYSVKRHPMGNDAGYFTALARFAVTNGDLGGKLLVSHIRRTDDPSRAEGEGLQPSTGRGHSSKNVNGNATEVSENTREENREPAVAKDSAKVVSAEAGGRSDVGQRDRGAGNIPDGFLKD
ncbi:hypothetical protein SLS58_002583 [Diplodia intermedia]|uniref:Uncharacterized protein n=1 Tax=Diplodia intermedia TaxID=856260 RepID=A0ABR3TZ61_9PEZI